MCTRCVVDDIFAAACRAPFEVAELRDDGGVSRRATDLELNSGNAAWYIHFFSRRPACAWRGQPTRRRSDRRLPNPGAAGYVGAGRSDNWGAKRLSRGGDDA